MGATWAGIFCYTEIADLWRLDFIYTEFADAWRLDFIYTEIADTLEIGFYLHRDCRYIGRCGTRSEKTLLFSSQMQTKFRLRFRVVFS